jgi:hypothetical protein
MSLTEREQEHLVHCLAMKAERRAVDAAIQNVADFRDVLLCAATNLECDVPQSQPAVATRLREVADEIVRMSLACSDLATTRGILLHSVLPAVQRREDLWLMRTIRELSEAPRG